MQQEYQSNMTDLRTTKRELLKVSIANSTFDLRHHSLYSFALFRLAMDSLSAEAHGLHHDVTASRQALIK